MNIKKLNIKEIEEKLNKTIRRDCVSIGFDTAERFTGVCILRANKEFIYIESLQLIDSNPKVDHFHRADQFVNSLGKFKQGLEKYKDKFKILVIEKCFFGKNVETLIHLAHFGILTYRELKDAFNVWYYFGANTARSIIGFNKARQTKNGTIKPKIITRGKNKGKPKKIECKALVHDYLKTDFNIVIENKDEADAFVLALAGLLR